MTPIRTRDGKFLNIAGRDDFEKLIEEYIGPEAAEYYRVSNINTERERDSAWQELDETITEFDDEITDCALRRCLNIVLGMIHDIPIGDD